MARTCQPERGVNLGLDLAIEGKSVMASAGRMARGTEDTIDDTWLPLCWSNRGDDRSGYCISSTLRYGNMVNTLPQWSWCCRLTHSTSGQVSKWRVKSRRLSYQWELKQLTKAFIFVHTQFVNTKWVISRPYNG